MGLAYGFLDESPALSDKDFFFCVDILSTKDQTNVTLVKIIKNARKRVLKKKLRSLSEIKFHNSDEKTRVYVLQEIAKQDIKIVALIVDKKGKIVKDSPLNYGIIVGKTVAECLSICPVLNMTLDKKFTAKSQEVEFFRAVQETVEILAPKNKNLVFNQPVESEKESLVQLADFIAGAIQIKYNRRDSHYVDIIKGKIVFEEIVQWTELKKRIVNS